MSRGVRRNALVKASERQYRIDSSTYLLSITNIALNVRSGTRAVMVIAVELESTVSAV
jgi:hypothetical protein